MAETEFARAERLWREKAEYWHKINELESKLKAQQLELEKARELIRDILKYETICSPDRYLLAEELLETKEGK